MSEDWRALGAGAARSLREGRWDEAVRTLERLVELNPGHADSWYNLGYARRHARHYAAALAAYDKALELEVRGSEEVRLNRAVILSEHLHDTAAAEAELEKALAARPDFTAAWLNLGNLREDLGEQDGAREAYEAALRASPGNGRALARLGAMTAHQGQPDEAIAFLEAATGSVRSGSEDSAELGFALGNALDAVGEYRRAFAVIDEANATAAALRPPEQRYDRRAQEALVDALIATFDRPAGPSASKPPVAFICGMFRSGSTLIEQMLARHSAVTAGGELEFIPAMVAEQLQPYPQSLADAGEERVDGLRQDYLGQLRALFPDASLVTDKRPDNFLHIGLIKTLFPAAKIVHTVRNPLDNILSAYFLYFSETVAYSERLDDIVHYYAQYRRLMDHWQALYGDDLFAVDYDRLVADPRSVLTPLLDFLGLDWEENCLDQNSGRSAVRTASVWQVRKPLHRKSSGRWRNYSRELEGVRTSLAGLNLLAEDD